MLKNIIKVLFSNAVLAAIGLINSFVFPILLSVEGYAYYQEYMLYLSYVNICHIGIASGMFLNYAGRKYQDTDKGQYKSEVYLIYIVLVLFSAIGLFLAGVAQRILILYVALSIFPQCIIASFQALYQAWERFTGYSIINALPKLMFSLIAVVMYFVVHKITGNRVIVIYVIVIWGISIYFMTEFALFTKEAKTEKIFSKKNMSTTINGFLITLGNYVNLLFHSIDKQFVNLIYSTTSFAMYSFAMSLQNIMMLFITALTKPFYPRLARGDVDKNYIQQLKEMLLMFGAYSGCAYFVVSFVVEKYITKYTDSMQVVAIFFAVFPAMAVINVIYINLYKVKRLLKKYILTLGGVLCIAIFLNCISVLLHGDYIGISLATMISYYIWLFYSQKDFNEIKLTMKDCLYLFGFFVIYSIIIIINNNILGFVLYALVITIWNFFIYKNTSKYVVKVLSKKYGGKINDCY